MRRALASLGALALVVLALAWTQGARGVQDAHVAPRPSRPASPAPLPSPSPVDLQRLRNVFRFADERAQGAPDGPRDPEPAGPLPEALPTPEPGPRLVGLVWRGSERKAVLTLAGSVEVAGPGEQAMGVTVVSVGDEAVRVRWPDGSEEQLELP